MKIPRKLAVTIVILSIAGLALFIVLLLRHGIHDIAQAIARAGWGLAIVVLSHFITLFFDTLSWRALLPKEHRPPLSRLFLVHWVGDSISTMLPVAQVGGEVVRVRMITIKAQEADQRAVPLPIATSSVLVGMTISLATQIVFTLSGLALLIFLTGHKGLTIPVIVGTIIGLACVAGFYAVQRVGIFRIITRIISRVATGDAWAGIVRQGEHLDEDVRACYARRGAMLESAFWTMCTWGAGAFEVLVALWALGIHANYLHAYALESLNQGIKSAMFLVPGTLGFQEGGYLLVGRLLGISSQGSLALSLIRRVRELSWGIPGLVVWQWLEGRRFWIRQSLTASKAP